MNIQAFKYRTELHAHTNPASVCSELTPEEVMEIYAGLGYHSVVICNHFCPISPFYGDRHQFSEVCLNDYDRAVEAGKKFGISAILGCEIRFAENANDYLLFGIDRDIFAFGYDYLAGGIAAFSKAFRGEDRLIIQAHPFRDRMTQIAPEYLDGIEVFNMHPNHNSRIGLAARYAKEQDCIIIAGSDYHHPEQEGLAALLTKTKMETSGDIARVLKSRDYLIELGGSVILPYGM